MKRICSLVFALYCSFAAVTCTAQETETEKAEALRLGKEDTETLEEEKELPQKEDGKDWTAVGLDSFQTPGKEAGERRVCSIGGVLYPFRWVPAGEFVMGSPINEAGRPDILPPWLNEIQQKVKINRGFWLMETELTREMWQGVMYYDLCTFTDDLRLPQETLSWDHLLEFCDLVKTKTGLALEPPTEEEWEYACRAGTESAYSGSGNLDEMGWYKGNSEKRTHCVGQKKPNAWGFFDMHGNVWEFCQDIRLRGGCYDSEPAGCRSAISGFAIPWFRDRRVGARLKIANGQEN